MKLAWLLSSVSYSIHGPLRGGAKHVYACEWNPNALDALRHNLQVNHVEDRCTILEGDNRLITLEVLFGNCRIDPL